MCVHFFPLSFSPTLPVCYLCFWRTWASELQVWRYFKCTCVCVYSANFHLFPLAHFFFSRTILSITLNHKKHIGIKFQSMSGMILAIESVCRLPNKANIDFPFILFLLNRYDSQKYVDVANRVQFRTNFEKLLIFASFRSHCLFLHISWLIFVCWSYGRIAEL